MLTSQKLPLKLRVSWENVGSATLTHQREMKSRVSYFSVSLTPWVGICLSVVYYSKGLLTIYQRDETNLLS